MAKPNPRLDAARKAPTPEAWARLLVAGKELSAAEDPPRSRRGRRSHQEPRSRSSRRSRRTTTPTLEDLEGGPREAPEPGSHLE